MPKKRPLTKGELIRALQNRGCVRRLSDSALIDAHFFLKRNEIDARWVNEEMRNRFLGDPAVQNRR